MAPPIIGAANAPEPEDQPFLLEDVKRLRLRPGDVLVLRASREVTPEWMRSCYDSMKRYFPDHRVIVLGPDVDLGVMGPEEEAVGQHPGEIGLN